MAPHDYLGETLEWEDLMRLLDARLYDYDASGDPAYDRTDRIDLLTPGGRHPSITQVVDDDGEPTGWTVTFDFEEDEDPRTYTVRSIVEVIDLIEAN